MERKLNVLLTGASGTVGIEVMRQLTSHDEYKLTVFDKKTKRSTGIFAELKNKATIIYGDISNETDVAQIPAGIDVVIHLAAIIPPLADEKPDLACKVNISGTNNIIQLLEKNSPNSFLLFSSSIAVYGDRIQNPNITTQDSLNAGKEDIYAQTKIEAENLIKNSKLNWSVFRLTAIMKNHKISKLMFHMPLSTIMEICTPKDTAKAFVEAINHRDELSRRVFNLGGGESCLITYRSFLEKSFNLFGLGAVNFPEHAFAERNFHCGIYADGYKLENILRFRSDNIDTYFEDQKRSIPSIIKFFSSIFRIIIKKSLLNQSEPLKAYRTKNEIQMNQFFYPKIKPVSIISI